MKVRVSKVLTVAESKRLIARGVVNFPLVKRGLKEGVIVIAPGTTNSYIVEEILREKIDKKKYTSGVVLPPKSRLSEKELGGMPDIVLKKGEIVKEWDRFTAPQHMKAGDVYIKGANALHYPSRTAGVLIGSPIGGTIGSVWGTLLGKKVQLIIPVGLEKSVPIEITELARRLQEDVPYLNFTPLLLPITGTIITEIEALEILAGVKAIPYAGGGIGGAEGSVRLLIEGEEENIRKAIEILEEIEGEPPFWGG